MSEYKINSNSSLVCNTPFITTDDQKNIIVYISNYSLIMRLKFAFAIIFNLKTEFECHYELKEEN